MGFIKGQVGSGQADMGQVGGQVRDEQVDIGLVCRQIEFGQADTWIVGEQIEVEQADVGFVGHGLQSLPPSPKRAERKGRRRPFREAGSGHKQWNTVSCVDTFSIISKFSAQNSKI